MGWVKVSDPALRSTLRGSGLPKAATGESVLKLKELADEVNGAWTETACWALLRVAGRVWGVPNWRTLAGVPAGRAVVGLGARLTRLAKRY